VSGARPSGLPEAGLLVEAAAGAAARAGVRPGDRIVAIDGAPPTAVSSSTCGAAGDG